MISSFNTRSLILDRKSLEKQFFYIVFLFSISFFILGCSNGSSKKFKINVDKSNTMVLNNDFKVDIPIGSLERNYSCSISQTNDKNIPVISGFYIYGKIYKIQHDGIILNKKATIQIRLDTKYIEGKYQIARYSKKHIEILDTSFKDGYLTAKTDGFSFFFIYTKKLIRIGEKGIYNELNAINRNTQKYYIAKVKNNGIIKVYKNSFSFKETKKIGSINSNEYFKAFVGLDNGKVRKVITNEGMVGYVESDKIEILENYDNFVNVNDISNIEILPENILLERLKKNKPNIKESINSNYAISLKTATKNNKNYILVELSSKHIGNFIKAHRGGLGLVLSDKLNIDQNGIEINYYNKKGQYIDAIELSVKYEDYFYKIINEISGKITGSALDFDDIKYFMELAGVGEIETLINKEILTSYSPDNLFIGKYFGSYQHANSYLYPKAATLQIAIPVTNSVESINKILIDNEIKLLLGTYLSDGVGRCTLIKNIKNEIPNTPPPDQVVMDYYKWEQNNSISVDLIEPDNYSKPPKLTNIDNYINNLKNTGWFSDNYLDKLKKFYMRCNKSLKKGLLQSFEFYDLNNIYFTQESLSALIVQDPKINNNKATVILKQCYPNTLACDFKINNNKIYIGKDCNCTQYANDIVIQLIKQNNKWVIDNFNDKTNAIKDISSKNYSNETNNRVGTMIDIDGNVYKTIKIGNQRWMAENFKGTRYADGTAISHKSSGTDWNSLSTNDAAFSYYDNDSNSQYGALYTWEAARKAAPSGWHLPTDTEWKQLEIYLGMSQSEADDTKFRGTNEGSKLASNFILWQNGVLKNNTAFDRSAFNALPGGYRFHNNGTFRDLGNSARFWSITDDINNLGARVRILYYYNSKMDREFDGKYHGYSVRYIKDN